MPGYDEFQATSLLHRMAERFVYPGARCIDATMGNGHDTEFLCRGVGPSGKVTAFDIQQRALAATRERLERAGLPPAELILDGHEHMDRYLSPGTVDLILFNLGYLPGGDHRISTGPETTLAALEQSLKLLRCKGAVCLLIYSGGDTGMEEKTAVMEWMRQLDPKRFLVLVTEYYNRPHHPPLPVQIIKLAE